VFSANENTLTVLLSQGTPKHGFLDNVGLSNICYTLELKKSSKTCLGERHNKGLIGKLL